ncbi:AI-2E family transporter [Qingshengfaniella alkalisoli]|uniref:AI-2E family transporter n=1 Tax=Qingshengfaniella alkalisoli TaxID=2599296 RepID=A0A5B8IVU8_9RHOB|nr:AI-2E family transporter [Qingshengfaniella alkalisoli]QDY69754.1 AI-2E family transporter [Qingshengfaniella alkalisoli]
MSVRELFYALMLTVLIGWLLSIGQSIILPVVIALMLAYVLFGASESLARWPLFRLLPFWMRYLIVLVLIGLATVFLGLVAIDNLRSIAASAPTYQQNAIKLVGQASAMIGLQDVPTWDTLRELTVDRIDIGSVSLNLLSSVASISGYVVLVATYVLFILLERGTFGQKLAIILSDGEERGAAQAIFVRINRQVVTYLSTKTMINVLLAVLSYVIMRFADVEYAVFWALMIGLLNYIPYVGSFLGVGIVVVFVLLQSGAWQHAGLALILLTAAQVYVGNWVEPRLMSRSLNLSPLVVLLSLVVWSNLWGVLGAIIAVPMTSIVIIILAAFPRSRFVPVLLSRNGEI